MNKGVEAVYTELFNPVWQGNPYLEALGKIMSMEESIEFLRTDPPLPENLGELDKEERKYLVENLKLGFYPLSKHKDLWDGIQLIIRSGYVGRNPLNGDDLKRIRAYEADNEVVNNTAGILALIGISGMGKTTSVKRILSSLPKIIDHTCYKGVKLLRKQIVWLSVECPCSETVEGFCRLILSAFDDVLGEKYYETYKCGNAEDMLITIKRLIEIHGVGCLYVDELQHLAGSSNDLNQLNNLLTTFSNMMEVPIIVAATPQVKPLFTRTLRLTRRLAGGGVHNWYRLDSAEDPEWFEWFSWLFNFQCTKTRTPLSNDLLEVFYEKSQGILDIASALFRKVQYFLISSPYDQEEVITREVVEDVFEFYFQPIVPIVEAIIKEDYLRMSELQDLLFEIEQDFSGFDFLEYAQRNKPEKEKEDSLENDHKTREIRLLQFFLERDLPIEKTEIEALISQVCQTVPDVSFEKAQSLIFEELMSRLVQDLQKESRVESFDYLLDEENRGEFDEF